MECTVTAGGIAPHTMETSPQNKVRNNNNSIVNCPKAASRVILFTVGFFSNNTNNY